MRMTLNQLRGIIKEELNRVLYESYELNDDLTRLLKTKDVNVTSSIERYLDDILYHPEGGREGVVDSVRESLNDLHDNCTPEARAALVDYFKKRGIEEGVPFSNRVGFKNVKDWMIQDRYGMGR
jgi:hypothetical protein